MSRLGSGSKPSAFVFASVAATASVTAVTCLLLLARRRRDGRKRSERCANLTRRASIVRAVEIQSLEDAQDFVQKEGICLPCDASKELPPGLEGMLAVFPGSFNPPTRVHVEICKSLLRMEDVDSVWLDMTVHTDKKAYVSDVLQHRLNMAEIATADMSDVGVTSLMSQLGTSVGLTSKYFDILRCLSGGRRIAWVMGSDVAIDMKSWKRKAKECILTCDCVVVYQRHHKESEIRSFFHELIGKAETTKRVRIETLSSSSFEDISSSTAQDRVVEIADAVPMNVLQYVLNKDDLTKSYEREVRKRREEEELAKRRQRVAAKRWSLDEQHGQCYACNEQFTLLNRKHHCRLCGHIFCGKCSNNFKVLDGSNSNERVRLCDSCSEAA